MLPDELLSESYKAHCDAGKTWSLTKQMSRSPITMIRFNPAFRHIDLSKLVWESPGRDITDYQYLSLLDGMLKVAPHLFGVCRRTGARRAVYYIGLDMQKRALRHA